MIEFDFSAAVQPTFITQTETSSSRPGELTEEEQQKVAEMKKRDQEVRAHEQAHLAAAGSLAMGGATYEYEVGPDGRRYAVAGSVAIDTEKVPGDPKATLEKAKRIQRAALAPQDPSPQDRKVAAEAKQMEMEAQQQINAENQKSLTSAYNQSGEATELNPVLSTFAMTV
ncbi:MAG: putative metalloprotease CJM1_0395 family protein [Calditrichia bacterium]